MYINKVKQINNMFFQAPPESLSTPPHQKYLCIPTNKCELSIQSGHYLPCFLVSMVGRLVEFWCTRSHESAPLIKCRKFSPNIVIETYY